MCSNAIAYNPSSLIQWWPIELRDGCTSHQRNSCAIAQYNTLYCVVFLKIVHKDESAIRLCCAIHQTALHQQQQQQRSTILKRKVEGGHMCSTTEGIFLIKKNKNFEPPIRSFDGGGGVGEFKWVFAVSSQRLRRTYIKNIFFCSWLGLCGSVSPAFVWPQQEHCVCVFLIFVILFRRCIWCSGMHLSAQLGGWLIAECIVSWQPFWSCHCDCVCECNEGESIWLHTRMNKRSPFVLYGLVSAVMVRWHQNEKNRTSLREHYTSHSGRSQNKSHVDDGDDTG